MTEYTASEQITYVSNFHDLVTIPFQGDMNAICWNRQLQGDFAEIVQKIELKENITIVTEQDLLALSLSPNGIMARETLLSDFSLLKEHGASPTLNLIKNYDRDDADSFFPTDVYSFHVDRSPIPTATFLCTYYGEASEIVANSEVIQKVLIPEVRKELRKLHQGTDEAFETFLSENFFDLHYELLPGAQPASLGNGHLWRLAVDHPQSESLPCVHRAPSEKNETRLMMIC